MGGGGGGVLVSLVGGSCRQSQWFVGGACKSWLGMAATRTSYMN